MSKVRSVKEGVCPMNTNEKIRTSANAFKPSYRKGENMSATAIQLKQGKIVPPAIFARRGGDLDG
jgi:lambda repressor-like predicted transcriptional regulator